MAQSNIKVADYTPAAGVNKANVVKLSDGFSSGVVTKYAKKYIDSSKASVREVIKRIASGKEGVTYTIKYHINKKANEDAEVTYLFIVEDDANMIESVQSYASSADFLNDLAFIDAQVAKIFK